jgi:hypothetical protein
MGAHGVGKVAPTERTQIRITSADHVCAELGEADALGTRHTPGDGVIRAVEKEQRSLLSRENPRSVAVHVHQTATEQLDAVSDCERAGTLEAL